jgi:two-component system response regulator YesN
VAAPQFVRRIAAFRRQKYFRRLMSTTVLLAVVPIFIVSIIAYLQVTKTFENETSEAGLQYLKQTTGSMEIIIDQIKQSSRQVLLNKSFSNFENFSNGAYYEEITGNIKPEDLETNYLYIRNKADAIQNFRSLILTNSFVDTAYFYDFYKGYVIALDNSGNIRQYKYEQFYDKGWVNIAKDSWPNSVILSREANLDTGEVKKMLTLVIRTELPNNAFIINLDEDKVYNSVIRKLNQEDDLYVISDSGIVVLQPRSSKERPEFVNSLIDRSASFKAARGYEIKQVGGEELLIAHSFSPILNWTFISITDLQQMNKSAAYLKQIIFLSAILLIVAAGLLSYMSSRFLYKPVRQITNVLRSNSAAVAPDAGAIDEWNFIGTEVSATLSEKKDLQQKLKESLPHYRERFKFAVITSRSAFQPDDFREKRDLLQIDIDPEQVMLLLLSLDDYKASAKELETREHELYKLEVIARIESSNSLPGKHFIVEIEEDLIAIALNVENGQTGKAFLIAQELIEMLQARIQGTFSVGVGRLCRTIDELPRAYEEAREALNYRLVHGPGQVISIEDVVIDKQSRYKYPKEKEEVLTGLIRLGHGEEAKTALHLIVQEIEQQKKNLKYTHIQTLFTQLLTGILQTLQQIGIDSEPLFERNLFDELYRLQSIKDITVWFEQLIDKAADQIGAELKTKDNRHVTKVIQMLEENLGAEWSLNIVSSRLQLNPAYVGRLFKQFTGKPFVEFLTELRLEHSKVLLTDPELTVNEVSRRIGYHNTYYFIKLFKESTGLTPGDYRKKLLEP